MINHILRLKKPKRTLLATALLCFSVSDAFAELEEIIVTATKRAESAQTIPLSISAVSGEELDLRGATEFFDYAVTIPNISFGAATDGVLSGRSISLRGIAGVNTTGFYIDDTPISETIDPRIIDVDRVEVLRGPQGTLYGGRSLGGTIRMVTKKPDFDGFSGKAKAKLSSTEESDDFNYLFSGSLNVPFSDSAAGIFSLYYEDNGGVFDRQVGTISNHLSAPASLSGPPREVIEDVDSNQTFALQAKLLFEIGEAISIEPRVIYQNTELDGFPLADINTDNFVQNRDFNVAEGGEDEFLLSTLTINYESNIGTFTSATSYTDRETNEFEDSSSFINFLQALPQSEGGFGLFDIIGVRPVTSPIFRTLTFESFVQEFRFASDFEGKFNFVVGAFYQDTDETRNFIPRNFARGLGDNFAALQQTLAIPGPLESIWPFGDLVFTSEKPSNTEELGVFGELTYEMTDNFTIVLGARWYDSEVSFSERRAGLAFGVPLAENQPLSTVPAETGSQSEDGTIFKAALEYQANDDLFIYASVAEGFRLGGANTAIPNSLGCPDNLAKLGLAGLDTSQFNSDDLTSYEIGVKSDIGASTRLNASAFLIDFEGIQQAVQLTCGFQFVGNFGSAESKGFEVELTTQLAPTFLLTANVGYTDAQFTETVFGGQLNSAGDPLQFVPEVTAAVSFDYETAGSVYQDMNFFARGDINYVDDSVSLVNGVNRPREGYEQIGLRFGLRNDAHSVTFFAKNLTNEIANLADNRSLAAETPGRPRFVISRPRTIGLEYARNF